MKHKNKIKPTREETEEAKIHPEGWVYRISGKYEPHDAIPPESIVGAWKVNKDGVIEGSFIVNPKFRE